MAEEISARCKKWKGALVSENALHFDGDKPNSVPRISSNACAISGISRPTHHRPKCPHPDSPSATLSLVRARQLASAFPESRWRVADILTPENRSFAHRRASRQTRPPSTQHRTACGAFVSSSAVAMKSTVSFNQEIAILLDQPANVVHLGRRKSEVRRQ